MSNRPRIRQKAADNGKELPRAYVCIGVPSGSTWYAAFAMCVWGLSMDSLRGAVPGYSGIDLALKNVRGSMLWAQRSEIMQAAVEKGCTHLLFVDTDQTFPLNMLRRLLGHHKPIVACNVAIKTIPSYPTARGWPVNEGSPPPIFTTAESSGLQEVYRIGTGIMLIDLKAVVPKLEQPWFKVSWGEEADKSGEDWWFCNMVEKAGIPIFIDHDLSWEIGHLGTMEYQHFHVPKELVVEAERMVLEEGAENYSHDLAIANVIERKVQEAKDGT